jgi:hypothetical protein
MLSKYSGVLEKLKLFVYSVKSPMFMEAADYYRDYKRPSLVDILSQTY